MRKIFFYLCVILGLPLWAESTSVPAEMIGGFPVANFAISAQMPESGDAFGFVWCNTGHLGGWLENCGQVHMSLRIGEKYYALEAWRLQEVKRTFPSASKSFRKHEALKKISLKVDAFSPLVLQDAEESALPVVMVDVDLEGLNTVKDSILLVVEPEKGDMIQAFGGKGEKPDGGGRLEMPVEVGKDGCAKVEFDSGNDEEMAEKMMKAVVNEEQSKEMMRKVNECVKDYSWENIKDRLFEIYKY